MSQSTMSIVWLSRISHASRPFSASVTRYPSRSTNLDRSMRLTGSSSVTRTNAASGPIPLLLLDVTRPLQRTGCEGWARRIVCCARMRGDSFGDELSSADRDPVRGRIKWGTDNPLVRAVARLRTKLRTKLLAAFLVVVALLVVVAVLGLRELALTNSRAQSIRSLQTHTAGYQNLAMHASAFGDLVAPCASATSGQAIPAT